MTYCVDDLERVRRILAHLIPSEAVEPWLDRKALAFGWRTPMEMILDGRTVEVIELLAYIEEALLKA